MCTFLPQPGIHFTVFISVSILTDFPILSLLRIFSAQFKKKIHSTFSLIFLLLCLLHAVYGFSRHLLSFSIISITLNQEHKNKTDFICRNLKVHRIYLDVFRKYLLTKWFVTKRATKNKMKPVKNRFSIAMA